MKYPISLRFVSPSLRSIGLLLSILLISLAGSVQAQVVAPPQVILTVNDADPSAVVFTATSGLSSLTNSGDNAATFYDGLNLDSFFLSPPSPLAGAPIGTVADLTTYQDETPFYNTFYVFENYVNAIIYNDEGAVDNVPETFTSGTQALAGSFTIDLSSLASNLPGAGQEGGVYIGDGFPDGTDSLIGEYEVIPEPSEGALIVLGLGVLVVASGFLRRGRRV